MLEPGYSVGTGHASEHDDAWLALYVTLANDANSCTELAFSFFVIASLCLRSWYSPWSTLSLPLSSSSSSLELLCSFGLLPSSSGYPASSSGSMFPLVPCIHDPSPGVQPGVTIGGVDGASRECGKGSALFDLSGLSWLGLCRCEWSCASIASNCAALGLRSTILHARERQDVSGNGILV